MTLTVAADGAIGSRGDGSQFYWSLVPAGWQMPIDRVRVRLVLPPGATIRRMAPARRVREGGCGSMTGPARWSRCASIRAAPFVFGIAPERPEPP